MEKTSSKRRTYKKSYFWLSVEIDMAHANVREIWYPPLTLCVKRNKARSYSWAFSKVEWGREPYQLANCSRLLKILPLLLMGPFLWGTSLWKMIPPPHFFDIQLGQLIFLGQWHVSRRDVCHFQQKVFRTIMAYTATWPFFLWQGQQCPKYEDSISLGPGVKKTYRKPIMVM